MSYEKLYQISFAIATLFAFTTFSSNLETNQRVYSAKNEVKTSTGVLETKKDWKENSRKVRTPEEIFDQINHLWYRKEPIRQIENLPKPIWKIIPKASASEKEPLQNTVTVKNVGKNIRTPFEIYEQVKHLGYREEPTIALISTCKGASLRPDHCILIGLVLMYNEAWNQQNSKACIDRKNCFGIQSWKKSYSSLDEGMENWVQKYNKYWYKADSASYFYSKAWKVSPSRYCTSEDSSGSNIGCPHGLSIASDKWSKLYKIIY